MTVPFGGIFLEAACTYIVYITHVYVPVTPVFTVQKKQSFSKDPH